MKPICLTMGDPAGVGPELVIKLLERLTPERAPRILLVGDYGILKYALAQFGKKRAKAWFEKALLLEPQQKISQTAQLNILSPSQLKPENILAERASKKHGNASWKYIEAGVKFCHSGICDAIITLPINKEALLNAGCPFPGHTDLLAHLDRKPLVVMMMVLGKIRVALLTHHLPLREVPEKISITKIISVLKIMNQSLKTDFQILDPKIGVLGLNPHAGEEGKIGKEELKIISPAIIEAQRQGIKALGPLSGDTAFVRARKGEFDAMLAMYHDQGIAPLKALGFEKVVNVSLGLNFIRTSPGHGTAYDIAWQGKANPESLYQAFKLTMQLIRNRTFSKK